MAVFFRFVFLFLFHLGFEPLHSLIFFETQVLFLQDELVLRLELLFLLKLELAEVTVQEGKVVK